VAVGSTTWRIARAIGEVQHASPDAELAGWKVKVRTPGARGEVASDRKGEHEPNLPEPLG